MQAPTRDAFKQLVEQVLISPHARLQMAEVRSILLTALQKKRFNADRAQELFCMAIERSIWKKHGSVGALTTRTMRKEALEIINEFASRYIEEFVSRTPAAADPQFTRPTRRGVLAKIFGK